MACCSFLLLPFQCILMRRVTVASLLLIMAAGIGHALDPSAVSSSSSEEEDNVPCDSGSAACPNPSRTEASANNKEEEECGLWLGPSPIKEKAEHGFGLGVFTGKNIPKGGAVEHELMIPLFDSFLHYGFHPPLREYVWDGDNAPEVALESRRGTFLFMPGLAAIAACTSKNYNLEITGRGAEVGNPRHNIEPDATGIHRSTSPMAGSFSYRHNVSYTAIRDIVAGEELTVQCDDDDYDGGAFYLSKFRPNDTEFVCVDNNVYVDVSDDIGGGRGLFAKHTLSEGSVITSTPLIPIDRDEMIMEKRGKTKDDDNVQRLQLLLNYCFGHVRSDLLLLPFGPLVNYINHPPEGKTANAVIQWHAVPQKNRNDVLPRRQQYHHPELFELPGKQVARTHGKGLMMDIVALREIAPDEEIYLDYGSDWGNAYKAHAERWKVSDKSAEEKYMSAADFNRLFDTDKILTVTEQRTHPYPSNLQTVCFFDEDDEDDDDEDKDDVYYWSSAEETDECLRPCIILDRYLHHEGGEEVYKAKMLPIDNSQVVDKCKLRSPEILGDVPRRAIRIVDRPYTTDTFLEHAFRHEIGVPEGFFPDTWMKKKLRGGGQTREHSEADYGHEFRRKIA